jgi:hypothetical protein
VKEICSPFHQGQSYSQEYSAMKEGFRVVVSNTVGTNHMWPMNTGNVAIETEEPIYKFYLILISLNLNINKHALLVVTSKCCNFFCVY